MTQWQPIETAPRDNKEIDVWCSFIDRHGNVSIGKASRFTDVIWSEADQAWEWEVGCFLRERSKSYPDLGDDQTVMIVTHWQPLPAPPSGET